MTDPDETLTITTRRDAATTESPPPKLMPPESVLGTSGSEFKLGKVPTPTSARSNACALD